MVVIEEIDEDGNGQIEIDEYLDWWPIRSLLKCLRMSHASIRILLQRNGLAETDKQGISSQKDGRRAEEGTG